MALAHSLASRLFFKHALSTEYLLLLPTGASFPPFPSHHSALAPPAMSDDRKSDMTFRQDVSITGIFIT